MGRRARRLIGVGSFSMKLSSHREVRIVIVKQWKVVLAIYRHSWFNTRRFTCPGDIKLSKRDIDEIAARLLPRYLEYSFYYVEASPLYFSPRAKLILRKRGVIYWWLPTDGDPVEFIGCFRRLLENVKALAERTLKYCPRCLAERIIAHTVKRPTCPECGYRPRYKAWFNPLEAAKMLVGRLGIPEKRHPPRAFTGPGPPQIAT